MAEDAGDDEGIDFLSPWGICGRLFRPQSHIVFRNSLFRARGAILS